jgi:uracil-DNA glycosylase family 4
MRAKPSSCDGCQLQHRGTDFSQVEGTGSLGVMIVAEASGEMEARDQLPLRPYAPAGSLLERTFRRIGYSRQQFSLTNTLRCRPPNNWLSGAPWEFSALNHCRPNLDAAIGDRRPRAILALGDTALRELTGEAGEARGVSHLAGYVLPTTSVREPCTNCISYESEMKDASCSACRGSGLVQNGGTGSIPVIPTFHPAFIRRGKASLQGLFARNLQRAVNVAAGRDREWEWDLEEAQRNGRIRYQVHPSLDEARSFVTRVRGNSGFTLSYDIETFESASLDEDARDGFTDTRIRLIQFSVEGGSGIALPWDGDYRRVAQELLLLPNTKCGHNLWLFDNRVLEACGAREGLDLRPRGPIHDTLAMFHHWQPDLPAHLQFAAQFVSFPFPWKHLAATDLEFYGCVDVDATLRLYTFLRAQLERDGIWDDQSYMNTLAPSVSSLGHTTTAHVPTESIEPADSAKTLITYKSVRGYVGQVAEVRPILAAMERRGLPVDDAERLKLDGEFDLAQQELDAQLQARVPAEVLGLEPRRGKKGNYDYGYLKTPKDTDGLVLRTFTIAAIDESTQEPCTRSVERYCRIVPFNANSGQQLLRYMDARKHKRPKSREQDDEGNDKDTTGKKELVRLAHRSGDDFYLKVIEYRELSKMRGTYIEGFVPHTDGRVHTTFTFDTGIGQLSSRNPNIQNYPKHGRLAKAVRKMIAAKPGHVLTEWDYKSCHVLTLGFLAEDANYIRCARIDMHSIVTGHKLGLWHAIQLLRDYDDAAIRAKCKWLKSNAEWKHIRDARMKHAILGIGNGLKARGLYEKHMEDFSSQKEAQSFLDVVEELFPKVFAWHKMVQQKAHDQQWLKTQYGHMRRFYEVFVWNYKKAAYGHGDQAEEAISYWLSNIAFGYIREHMKLLEAAGLNEKYGLCNNVHDSLMFHFPAAMLDEHVREVYPLLVTPSKVLTHPTICPEGLWIDAEANAGPNWAEMEEVAIPKEAHLEATPVS